MSDLGVIIVEKLKAEGASLVGFADISNIDEESSKGHNYGISIAVKIDPETIMGIKDGPTHEYYSEYKRLNTLLDRLSILAADILNENGYKAFPQTLENVVEDESTWRTALPHKTLATMAGLGWIGKCALLVTPEYGSAIRLTSVLTNAELECGSPITESRCGSCTNCYDACPGNAVLGDLWTSDTDRDKFFNPFDCRKAARARAAKIGINATLCGACIYACPWTQKYISGVK